MRMAGVLPMPAKRRRIQAANGAGDGGAKGTMIRAVQEDGYRSYSSAEDNGTPRIAVVIPVYRQPQYLADAVLSVVRQSIGPDVRAVIVNDGCPFARTDWLGQFFVEA